MPEKHSRAALIAHLNAKVREQDWAAVSEAANDLRNFDILEARSTTARADRTFGRRQAPESISSQGRAGSP